MAEPSKQDSTMNALGAGANPGTAIDDSRRVQKTLIDTKIPLKRSHQQRRMQQKRSSAAYRDDDSDMDQDEESRTTNEGVSSKRQNQGADYDKEYDSPPEDAQADTQMTEE